jgi:hypothetical protein
MKPQAMMMKVARHVVVANSSGRSIPDLYSVATDT